MRAWAILPVLCLTASCAGLLHSRPHEFACGSLLDGQVIEDHAVDPVTLAIHGDAGGDDPDPARIVEAGPLAARDASFSPLIAEALRRPGLTEAAPVRMLLLSGGGQWGAFGAGFLSTLYPRPGAKPYDLITGVSTGAIQGLFAANGDWPRMRTEYRIKRQGDIARDKGDLGLVTMGASYDTAPLRRRLHEYLCGTDHCQRLRALAADGRPTLFVGIVRAADGELRIANLTKLVAQGLTRAAPETIEPCVTGLVMASAAVPAQLRPVRIDGATYVDGGVRASVFAGVTARTLAESAKSQPAVALDVIRNGPTIVFRNRDPDDPQGPAPVDREPTVLAVGRQSYATIVNQTEVASIALLRLLYPEGDIRVMTADGFYREQRCVRPDDRAFDPTFMACLVDWGERKAAGGAPAWIVLDKNLARTLSGAPDAAP